MIRDCLRKSKQSLFSVKVSLFRSETYCPNRSMRGRALPPTNGFSAHFHYRVLAIFIKKQLWPREAKVAG
jgi:hypothetical protein